ncbi:MAG: D-alanine--D-alanine ligase [Bacteroidetes bacterium]|nr:MAG: D-alanine--D-alanine ligase [Bacteroidota bacterium]
MPTVALLFGGQSPEHEVSIRSARNIYAAIDKSRYQVVLVGIDKAGRWFHLSESELLNPELLVVNGRRQLGLIPGARRNQIVYLDGEGHFPQIEVVFPITHGPYGEDGTLQGILRHLSLPFVGPDVLGSAACMDKDVTKRLLREADLLVAPYLCFHYFEKEAIDYAGVVNQLGTPLFIKPANMGSSVGVRKVENKAEFDAAIAEAFRYDHKILIEEMILGREVECAVMGNAIPEATTVGEVVMEETGFYDYESKYVSATAARTDIPALGLDEEMLNKLMLVARQAYRTLGCEGLSRVDMFVCEDGKVYINEINTLPGFTQISMYPKLWAAADVSYPELLDRLIQFAIERGEREARLEKSL